ncbi:MAG: peptidylprolyl isomerase [Planctomycetota bacterium]
MEDRCLILRKLACLAVPVVICICVLNADSHAADANSAPARAKALEPNSLKPDEVAVTVNSVGITEGQVNAEVAVQMKLMKLPSQTQPQTIEKLKKQLRRRALETLIARTLLDKQLKEAEIVVTDKQVMAHVKEMVSKLKLSLEDFEERLKTKGNDSLEDWIEQMQLRRGLAYNKLFETRFEGKINVTEDDAREFYEANRPLFQSPEKVRVSHILITPEIADANTDPNQAAEKAKARAQTLLKKIKDGADFAELAKAKSKHPSAADGGDLGFSARGGPWVAPFEKEAFALQAGQVSDVVESQFGYHIIKVTDRKEAGVIPFEETKDKIIKQLTTEKRKELIAQFIRSLKAEAAIVYPPGKDPVQPRPPSGKPAPDSDKAVTPKQKEASS